MCYKPRVRKGQQTPKSKIIKKEKKGKMIDKEMKEIEILKLYTYIKQNLFQK